jgi:hypothetical protein
MTGERASCALTFTLTWTGPAPPGAGLCWEHAVGSMYHGRLQNNIESNAVDKPRPGWLAVPGMVSSILAFKKMLWSRRTTHDNDSAWQKEA